MLWLYKTKSKKIYSLLSNTLNISILYSAILVLCEVDENNPMNLIKTSLLSDKLEGDYCDTGVRIGEIIDDKFYKNFSFNTTKQITINKKIDADHREIILPLISLTNATIDKEGITITYEINDKYQFDNLIIKIVISWI